MLLMSVGATIGGYAPTFFGVSAFSFVTILTSLIGGVLGIWLALKLTS